MYMYAWLLDRLVHPVEAGLELMPRVPAQDERQPDGIQTQDLEQTLVRLRPRQEDHRLFR